MANKISFFASENEQICCANYRIEKNVKKMKQAVAETLNKEKSNKETSTKNEKREVPACKEEASQH